MESRGIAGDGGMGGAEKGTGRGLGYRAYLFSGMMQVPYPQLRLAHLFMLNATPWEVWSCHGKYRKPFFSLSTALQPTAASALLTCQTLAGISLSHS